MTVKPHKVKPMFRTALVIAISLAASSIVTEKFMESKMESKFEEITGVSSDRFLEVKENCLEANKGKTCTLSLKADDSTTRAGAEPQTFDDNGLYKMPFYQPALDGGDGNLPNRFKI